MVLIFLLGLLDVAAGVLILIADSVFLPSIARYVGIAVLLKGIWSLLVSRRSF